MSDRGGGKAGAICAIVGSLLLLTGTMLHPMDADPNDAPAAFAEYAADHGWVASHLTQLAGVTLIVAALLVIAQQIDAGRPRVWARVAAGGAIASLAVAAALQAVDGIALKSMVNAWAAAPPRQKDAAFHAAFGVRQIEVGLASVAGLVFGLTVSLFGIVLLDDRTYPRWVSVLALAGGVPMTIAGIFIAYTGFSATAMDINLTASTILLVWMVTMGVLMWRRRAPADG